MKSLLALVLVVFSVACSGVQKDLALRDATIVSNTAITSIEAAESTAILLYREAQLAAVADVKASCGGPSEECFARATEAVRQVREGWAPVWRAFDAAVVAHSVLADAIEAVRQDERAWIELVPVIAEAQQKLRDVADMVRERAGEP